MLSSPSKHTYFALGHLEQAQLVLNRLHFQDKGRKRLPFKEENSTLQICAIKMDHWQSSTYSKLYIMYKAVSDEMKHSV